MQESFQKVTSDKWHLNYFLSVFLNITGYAMDCMIEIVAFYCIHSIFESRKRTSFLMNAVVCKIISHVQTGENILQKILNQDKEVLSRRIRLYDALINIIFLVSQIHIFLGYGTIKVKRLCLFLLFIPSLRFLKNLSEIFENQLQCVSAMSSSSHVKDKEHW